VDGPVAVDEVATDQSNENYKGAPPDPALTLSRAWVEAHARTLALCVRQQQLETEIVRSVGFPSANIALPDGEVSDGCSLGETDALGDAMSVVEIGRAEASDVLADHWARWRAKDAELGYSAAKEAEQQAAEKEQAVLDRLARTPASSIAGVIAKLAVVLRDVEDNRDASDFPMPQLRSVLEDLTWVAQHTGQDGLQPLPSSDAGAANGPFNTRG
jgi:hypothetical protein